MLGHFASLEQHTCTLNVLDIMESYRLLANLVWVRQILHAMSNTVVMVAGCQGL